MKIIILGSEGFVGNNLVNGLSAISLLIVRVIVIPCSSAALLGVGCTSGIRGSQAEKPTNMNYYQFFWSLFEVKNRLRMFHCQSVSPANSGSSY